MVDRTRSVEDKEDIMAVAEAIELAEWNSSEAYAEAAIAALKERGWLPPLSNGGRNEPA